MKQIKYLLGILLFFGSLTSSFSQNEKRTIRHGLSDYEKGDFAEAEVNFKKVLDKDPLNQRAQFNLGNTHYSQENFEESALDFRMITQNSSDKQAVANSYYNLGNSLMSQEKYGESFQAYKNALKLNPDDDDARYNLEYARLKMMNEPQQQDQDQQNQDQQQDKDQENQDQQDQKQDEQQPDDGTTQQQQNQQNQERKEQQMSKEDAERMLQALQNEEKETLEKVTKKKMEAMPKQRNQKDW